MSSRVVAGLAALLLPLAVATTSAWAEGLDCRVRSIAPSIADAPADDKLADIEKILDNIGKAAPVPVPFKSYSLTDDHTVHVELHGESAPLALPNGKQLVVSYLEHQGTPKARVKFLLTIGSPPQPGKTVSPDVSSTQTLDDGGTLIQVLDMGTSKLLVAETCKASLP